MAEKEYIEREAIEKAFAEEISTNYLDDYAKGFQAALLAVMSIPIADVAPVRHGHQIEEYDCGYITPHCSECGETALTKEETSYDYVYSSYCPRCGAKMGKTEQVQFITHVDTWFAVTKNHIKQGF